MRLFPLVFAMAFLSIGCAGNPGWVPVSLWTEVRPALAPDSTSATMVDEDILAIQVDNEERPTFLMMRRWDDRGGVGYAARVCCGDRCLERSGFIPDTERFRAMFRLSDDGEVLFTPPVDQAFCAIVEMLDECREQ